MKKIILVYPLSGSLNNNFDHIGLGYIASTLMENGFNVEIVNISNELESINRAIEKVNKEKPIIVGVSVINDTAAHAMAFATSLRKAHYEGHVCFGGYYPTFYDQEVLKDGYVDSVIRCEGEIPFLNLARHISKHEEWRNVGSLSYLKEGVIVRNALEKCCDIDQIPIPYRPNLGSSCASDYNVYISTSRGCYGNCMYCSIQSFYEISNAPRWRGRSPESVVDEIEKLYKEHNARRFIFIDDDFIPATSYGKERAKTIAQLIIERQLNIVFFITCNAIVVEENLFLLLKKAGLRMVSLGIESSNSEILTLMKKATTVEKSQSAVEVLKKLNLAIDFGMISFNPFTTIDTLRSDIKMIRMFDNYKPNIIPLNYMKLRRGTPGYTLMKKDGCEENKLGEINWEYKNDKVKTVYEIYQRVFIQDTLAAERIDKIVFNLQKKLLDKSLDTKKTIEKVESIYKEIRLLTSDLALGILDDIENGIMDSETIIKAYTHSMESNLLTIESVL